MNLNVWKDKRVCIETYQYIESSFSVTVHLNRRKKYIDPVPIVLHTLLIDFLKRFAVQLKQRSL